MTCGARPTEGSALVFSVIAVVVVSLLAGAFLQLVLAISRREGSASDTWRALHIAEAGLVEAYTGMAQAKTGNVGTPERPAVYGGGLFWVERTASLGREAELRSTGMYGSGRVTLAMTVERNADVGRLGIFTDDSLHLNPDTLIDSFDSRLGSYADQVGSPLNNQTAVGSNQDVDVQGQDIILGDVMAGPSGTVKVANNATVTGSTGNRAVPEVFPDIDVPSIPSTGDLLQDSVVTKILPGGEYSFGSVDVASGSTLVLEGPMTLVVEDFYVKKTGELVFDTTNGPIDVYVTGNFDLKSESTARTTHKDPAQVQLLIAADALKTTSFFATSTFHGLVYAPHADVKVGSKFELFGAMVAKSLNLSSQGRMHTDLKLRATPETVLPPFKGWRIAELPEGIAAHRLSPFVVLGLDRNDLPKPADAHQDQQLELRYRHVNGSLRTYAGWESDFDWTEVAEVLFGARDGIPFVAPEGEGNPLASDPYVELVESDMSSKDLMNAILEAAPVSNDALVAACHRDPPMAYNDLLPVLEAHYPLDDSVLLASISSVSLDSQQVAGTLVENSPLSDAVLGALLDRYPPLDSGDLNAVLDAQ